MEEKLYFKPEHYGQKKDNKPKEKSEKKNRRIPKLLGFLLLIVIIVLIIIWLLRGKTTVSGRYPENVKTESLTCVSTELTPEKLSGADAKDKEVKINAIFRDVEELKSISLTYTLNYASSDETYGYEAKSHAEFNKSLSASGYSVSKFKNKFARYDSDLIISLFAEKNELDQIAAPYFMLSVDKDGSIPGNISEYKKNYEAQGFSCESSIDK